MESSLDLRKWHIFSLLEPAVLSRIKRAWVFDSEGELSVLFSTKEGEVRGFGKNLPNIIEVSQGAISISKPGLITQFQNKKMEKFSFGKTFIIGLTEHGQVYQCGLSSVYNKYDRCYVSLTNLRPKIIEIGSSKSVKIIEVACGQDHTLALSSDGRVYAWGNNKDGQIGIDQSYSEWIPSPCTETSMPTNDTTFCTSISCGLYSSYALLNDGRAYFWGKNYTGAIIHKPEQIECLALDFISKIVCGIDHTLALTKQGTLYTWGSNNSGELGTGNLSRCLFPKKISWNYGRIINIAAINTSRISVAVTNNTEIYVWGGVCRGMIILEPRLTPFKSIQEVFCNFSDPPVSYGYIENIDISGSVVQQNNINHTLRTAFNDPESCDFKIQVDDQLIHVHKTILILRSKYFQAMLANDWKEGKENVLIVKNRTCTVYEAFLKYLYTDIADVPFEDTFELLDIAEEYLDENLKEICMEIIKRETTVENVATLYAKASSANMNELKQFCSSFIFKRMKAVTQSQGFKNLASNIQLEIFVKATENDLFKI